VRETALLDHLILILDEQLKTNLSLSDAYIEKTRTLMRSMGAAEVLATAYNGIFRKSCKRTDERNTHRRHTTHHEVD
jgi:hypothetical protein